MTQKEFDAAIRRLVRRADLLREARDGSVRLRVVEVRRVRVKEHTRAAHVRYIAPRGWRHEGELVRGLRRRGQ